jgi:hypothetical protein
MTVTPVFRPTPPRTSWPTPRLSCHASSRRSKRDEALDSDTSGLNGGSGGHIPTIVVSNSLKTKPVQDATPVDTVGILRSLEDTFGLPYLAGAADAANGTIDSLLNANSASPSGTP